MNREEVGYKATPCLMSLTDGRTEAVNRNRNEEINSGSKTQNPPGYPFVGNKKNHPYPPPY